MYHGNNANSPSCLQLPRAWDQRLRGFWTWHWHSWMHSVSSHWMEAVQRMTWVTCEAITSPQKPIPVQWVAVRIQRKRNSLQTVRVKPTVVIRTLLWPRNISKCERVRSTRHGTGRGGEGVLSLLLLEYAVCHFCFLVHGLPSFLKNNYQGSLEVSWTKR